MDRYDAVLDSIKVSTIQTVYIFAISSVPEIPKTGVEEGRCGPDGTILALQAGKRAEP